MGTSHTSTSTAVGFGARSAPGTALCLVVAMLVAPGLTHAFDPHVFVVGGDGSTGEASTLTIDAPWTATPDVESVGGVPIVRHFFGLHYVVNRDSGTIQVIDPETFDTVAGYAVGSGLQDIAVIGARQAFVTRFDSPALLEIDPTDGTVTDSIDLGFLDDADGIPEMSMMAVDGYHLIVQVQQLDGDPGLDLGRQPAAPRSSSLAVIDVRTNEVVDVDPLRPGVQPIALQGFRPAYKMFVEADARRLYVSVPAGFFDGIDGAIEEIDLDSLQSLGFITTETTLQTLDLSAFTLVAPDKGFVVTHTEFVESSHVTGFSRQTGVPVSQIYTTLLGSIRSIVHDAETSQVFLPDSTPDGTLGILVFDAVTDTVLTPTPVDVGAPPIDLVVARPVSPGEVRDVRVESFDRGTGELALSYEPACGAADHTIVFGPLGQVSSYGYSGQDCAIGNLGSYGSFDPGTGSAFFLIVGNDGRATEGSYGSNSSDAERPEDFDDPECSFDRELAFACEAGVL